MDIIVFGKQVRCYQVGCGECAGMVAAAVTFAGHQYCAIGKTPAEVKAKLEAEAGGWKYDS